jgi:hypothetical protein
MSAKVESIEREIDDAVRAAINEGVSVEDFRRECVRLWDWAMRDKVDEDACAWSKP